MASKRLRPIERQEDPAPVQPIAEPAVEPVMQVTLPEEVTEPARDASVFVIEPYATDEVIAPEPAPDAEPKLTPQTLREMEAGRRALAKHAPRVEQEG